MITPIQPDLGNASRRSSPPRREPWIRLALKKKKKNVNDGHQVIEPAHQLAKRRRASRVEDGRSKY
jgi:hypothetical protein